MSVLLISCLVINIQRTQETMTERDKQETSTNGNGKLLDDGLIRHGRISYTGRFAIFIILMELALLYQSRLTSFYNLKGLLHLLYTLSVRTLFLQNLQRNPRTSPMKQQIIFSQVTATRKKLNIFVSIHHQRTFEEQRVTSQPFHSRLLTMRKMTYLGLILQILFL